MRTYLLGSSIACMLIAAAAIDLGPGCKPAETAILDLGDAECALLAQQPTELVVEVFACEVFDVAQQLVQTFEVQMPAAQATAFAAAHPIKAGHPPPAGTKAP